MTTNINPLVLIACKQGSHRGALVERLRDDDVAAEYVRDNLNYCALTGVFTNKTKRDPRLVVGETATTRRGNGYLVISLRGAQYLAHRVAWLYQNGRWPDSVIDHINGDITDNRICNLRNVSAAVNIQNRAGPQKNSKTGMLGVSFNKGSGKFRAAIKAFGVHRTIGLFDTPEQAQIAYLEAKKEWHKEVAK